MNKKFKMIYAGREYFRAFTLAEGATHVGTRKGSRKVAFTLAEVLITLGVIGVVSAITLPTLLQNHKKQVTVTMLKKAYSEISQAIKMSEVHNGEMENWDFSDIEDISERNKYFAEHYIFPYLKTTRTEGPVDGICGKSCAMHANIASGYSITTWQDSTGGWVYVDIDGHNNGKNEEGKDIFGIKFVRKTGNLDTVDNVTKKGIYLAGLQYLPSKTRDELKAKREYCGALIMYDSWKISDDNPCWK